MERAWRIYAGSAPRTVALPLLPQGWDDPLRGASVRVEHTVIRFSRGVAADLELRLDAIDSLATLTTHVDVR